MRKKTESNHPGPGPATSRRSFRDLACTVLSAVLSLVAGWLDLHVTEVIITVVALYVFGMLPGLIQPDGAWRWALIIAIGLPTMEMVAIVFGLQTTEPVHLDLRIALVALASSLLGAYSGVFVRYVLRI